MSEVIAVEQSKTLTTSEQQRLYELESVVERGLKTFVEVGNALMEIRDSRLYRETYGTFEDYCRERWGMQRAHAYRLIDASKVVANLSPMGDTPTNERQTRPLVSLDPESQRAAWQRAVDTAPNGKVTGAHVERTVDETTKPDPVPAPDPLPEPRVAQVSADFMARVLATYSGDRISEGRIKRPFEYEGNQYVTVSNYRSSGEAKRVVPAGEWPFKPVESHRKAGELNKNGPGYYHGWKVHFGSQPFVLDATDRIEFVLVDDTPADDREQMDVYEEAVEVSEHTSNGDRLHVHFSSDRQDWETPQDLFDELHAEFGFDVDVCANEHNYKRPYYSEEDDALQLDWNTQTCWMNPPYGRAIGEWVKKAYESARAGATVVCLLPARTDTRWWWDYVIRGEVRFLKGRLRFVGAENGAPFPSAVVVFRPGVLAPDSKVVWWERDGGELDDA